MDPDATLEEIRTALAAGNTGPATEAASDLSSWVLRGGFAPSDATWRDTLAQLGLVPPETELEAG
ncbi:MAG TPA: hypothetical protein VMU94_11350 [Streptosporangiaceae bacterium]|nr:hypothetical protein [Streptosporangiaceae bacterium]